MSEVTKKSDTSSSQMRLLGGTPHMCYLAKVQEPLESSHGVQRILHNKELWIGEIYKNLENRNPYLYEIK